jgi:hypothetical protein
MVEWGKVSVRISEAGRKLKMGVPQAELRA